VVRFFVPGLLFALLVAVLAIGLNLDNDPTKAPSFVPSPLIGKPAPDFTLPELLDGERSVSRQDLLGKFSLVNVWATWCAGCRQEHGFLLQLARESGIPIYGLNWKDDPLAARQWLGALGNPYAAIAVDADGRTAIDWGVYGAPETFLIGPDGTVIYKHIAPLTREIWEQQFEPRIRALRSPT
jgi:cytochrome c biogenesis protein CcmG/thiol:disulfide interchange protein DsbE